MHRLGHYTIHNTIHTTGQYIIYAATHDDSAKHFLIKTLTQANMSSEALAQLQHEYYLLERLNAVSSHFPKIIEFIDEASDAGIVFEDEGYRPLSESVSLPNLELFFPIAIQITDIVATIHNLHIIHKHLTPFNIFYHPEKKSVQIYDFSIATELTRSMVPTDPPRLLQGTLEYMAPEQTGRMNRSLTQRADLYSLGIIFYEWLTGSVPFRAKEPMTVIFGHIATIPPSPHEIDVTVPKILSDIVMKLLSKPAEERYKSAVGLEYDLEQLYTGLKEHKDISNFYLAQKDISMHLELPDKLYGREEQVALLYETFDELCDTGENKLMTVSGYSGIGKTSLVRELIKKIALAKGFFASGKFDKFQQSDTYEGLRWALDKVVRYHLSLPEAEYQAFKRTVIDEMGVILPVITDFVPRLVTIVGKQESLTEVGIEATKNRFELAVRRFVKIASLHHPLVLFLDDMQWANYSMFELLQKLVISEDIQNLLVIVSYRSNEVTQDHPLMQFLEKVSKTKPSINIQVEGLTEDALNQLLQDMLYLHKEEVASLSHLMAKKTEGNPFFLLMVLEELYREEELYFDIDKNRWLWDEDKIMSLAASDNVLDFVTRRIEKLPIHIKDVLHLAACIGNTFSIEELSLAQMGHVTFLTEALYPAIQDGLVLPTKLSDEWSKGVSEEELLNREYRFQHDKIQQSCYEIDTLERSKKTHLQLARNWYHAYGNKLSTTRIMAIVEQYNKGINYIADTDEKNLVCQLNYDACKIALQSAAYEIAYQYSSVAKSLLNPQSWNNNYELTFNVFLSYIKSAFLNHHFDSSKKASKIALSQVSNNFDKAKLLGIDGDLARATGKTDLQYYEEALRLLGYAEVVKIPSKLRAILTVLIFRFYVERDRQAWDTLPTELNQEVELAYVLTERITEESYYSGNVMRYAYAMTRYALKTFPEHNIDLRAMTTMAYTIIWPRSIFSKTLYNKAQVILTEAKNTEMSVTFYFASTVLHLLWRKPLKESAVYFQRAKILGEQTGHLEFSAQSLVYIVYFKILSSLKNLHGNIIHIENQIGYTSGKGLIRMQMLKHYVEYLTQDNENSPFHQQNIIDTCKNMNYPIGEYAFHTLKLSALIHCMETEALLDNKDYIWSILQKINHSNSVILVLPANFYLFMLEIAAYTKLPFKEKLDARIRIYSLYRRVKSWVKLCPENFMPYHMMMKAEYQRLKGNLNKALMLYDKTIRVSREYESPECASLACQRALDFCVAKNKIELAKPYADMAVRAYEEWGAYKVVGLLKKKYSDLLSPELMETEVSVEIPLTETQKQKQEERARYALDVRSIVFAADAINKEIHLDSLLNNVMQLLVENIGATKSALCLIQKGSLWVEGFYDSDKTAIETLQHTHWQEAPLSQEVLLMAWREQKEVILLDVSLDTELNAGDYFAAAETKCLIACPIIRGSRVVGVIYCENNISTHAFSPERIDILRALSIQMSIAVENSRLYTTFEKFVPKPFLSQLGQEFIFDIEQGDSIEKHMNVLFMDIRNFTSFSELHTAEEAFKFINQYLRDVTPAIHSHHGFIDKFLGDGIMALFPTTSDEALQSCIEMQHHIYRFSDKNNLQFAIKVGMGLHYGPLMLGIVGEKQHIEGTVIGDTVNVAARLESFNKLYGSECLISDSVKKRLLNPEDYDLRLIGQITLLGRKEPTAIWQVLKAIHDENIRKQFMDDANLFETAYQNYLERQFDMALRDFNRIVEKNPHDQVAQFYSDHCRVYLKNPPPEDWHGEIEMTVK